MRTVVIRSYYVFYLIQQTQWESRSTSLNYLAVIREGKEPSFVTWAPAFKTSPMVIVCLPVA